MSDAVFFILQFIFIIWPLFIAAALIYSFSAPVGSGRRSRKRRISGALSSLGLRLWRNILLTWAFLFVVWIGTLFGPGRTPSLIPEPWNTGIFLGGFGLMLLLTAARLGLLSQRMRARLDFHRAANLQILKTMDPYGFEALVTETYRAFGYQVQHVGHSGDHGVDIELRTHKGEFWIAQCKRYNDSVGESIIRDLYGTMVSEKADRAILVTTAEITPPARTWARGKPIDLVDGPALIKLIAEARDRTDGTLFDRMAHFFGGLLLNFGRPAGLRQPGFAQNTTSAPVPDVAAVAVTTAVVGSRNGGSEMSLERTQPVRVRPQAQHSVEASNRFARLTHAGAGGLSTENPQPSHHPYAPLCPVCHVPMVIRPPRQGDAPGRAFFRCANYPTCRVVIEVPVAAPRS